MTMNKIKIPKSYTALCYYIADNYSKIEKGIHFSFDKKYKIVIKDFEDKNNPVKKNVDNNDIELKSNLKEYSKSSILFFLVRCFIQDDCKSDFDSDNSAFTLLEKLPDFNKTDVINDLAQIYSLKKTNKNSLRIKQQACYSISKLIEAKNEECPIIFDMYKANKEETIEMILNMFLNGESSSFENAISEIDKDYNSNKLSD